jgi:AcrR family transcriptional regulator
MATQSERREATRAAIVKAAKRLFGERGFAGTTMDNVATAAHVAKGAVYHHFETKEALFETVFDEVSQDPAVLGWERWREIDAKHFGGGFHRALARAMDDGLIARQSVEPLSRLLIGAVTEAAVACSAGGDLHKTGAEYARAFQTLLDALRTK